MATFTPPIVYDQPLDPSGESGLWKYYGGLPRGRSVLLIGGVYSTVDNPDQITLATATEVYMGGRSYTITSAQATALSAAGYGAYIT